MEMPNSLGGKAKCVLKRAEHLLEFKDNPESLELTCRKERAREFEKHAENYYKRKYGKDYDVEGQKTSTKTRKRADITVKKRRK